MSVVSRRYARALVEVLSPDRVDTGLAQLRRIELLLGQQPDARQLLLNPAVPADRRAQFIGHLSGILQLDPAVQKLLSLLVERRRLGILSDLIESYQSISDERRGIVRARVTTVEPLSDSDRQELIQRLEVSTGKRVIVQVEQDAGIIGGLVVRIGSTVFDGSIRQQLSGLKHRLQTG